MNFVIDTSVAVKWFLTEEDHAIAVALLETKVAFSAPDLIFTEFASALQKKIRLGEITHNQAMESCTSLPRLFASITPTIVLFQRALETAIAMAHPVQDCIFLACAEREGTRAITADRKLVQKAEACGFGYLVFELIEGVNAIVEVASDVTLPAETLENIIRLSERIDMTFHHLRERHLPASEGFHFIPANVFGPAFEASAYLRLKQTIMMLPRDQIRDLVALCWLGRGYDGTDWAKLRDRADAAIGNSFTADSRYVLSLVSYLQAGIDRVTATQSDPATIHRDT